MNTSGWTPTLAQRMAAMNHGFVLDRSLVSDKTFVMYHDQLGREQRVWVTSWEEVVAISKKKKREIWL